MRQLLAGGLAQTMSGSLSSFLSVDRGPAQRLRPAVPHLHHTGREDLGPAFPQAVENSV